MNYRNRTEQVVMNMLKSSVHVWENLSQAQKLSVLLVHTEYNAYALFANNAFTGAFITDTFINLDEAKEVGFKVKGAPKPKTYDKPLTAAERKKLKRKERKEKKAQREALFNDSEE